MKRFDLGSTEVGELWNGYCKLMAAKQSEAAYHTWILSNPIVAYSIDDSGPNIVTFASPTAFHSTNFQKSFLPTVVMALEQVVNKPCIIQFVIHDPSVGTAFPQKNTTLGATDARPPIPQPTHQNAQRTANNELFSEGVLLSAADDRLAAKARSVGLRPDYTFDTFAVSTSNELAHAAAVAVSQKPGESYSPLFFYGGVGVGKTHLMHAIGYNILKTNPNARIIYCTGEEFTNDIVHAIQTKRASQFKDRYRNCDVLLMDDIQFIAGKNAVQEEFFHTFNALSKLQKQIVLTSDQPLSQISLLEDRLRSRFEAGLIIDIQQPSFELRTAIVLIKCSAWKLPISVDLAKKIAINVKGARQIEGVISLIRGEAELKGSVIDDLLVSRLVSSGDDSNNRSNFKPNDVIKAVSDYYKVPQMALKGKERVQRLVMARHVAMYILRHDLSMSLVEIGKWFSGRDHTSVMHAVDRIELLMSNNSGTLEEVMFIRAALQG